MKLMLFKTDKDGNLDTDRYNVPDLPSGILAKLLRCKSSFIRKMLRGFKSNENKKT